MRNKNYIVYMLQSVKKINSKTNSKTLEEAGAMEYTTIVAATASDSAPLQFFSSLYRLCDGRIF